MAIKTYTEQLEEVQAAISNILTNGQAASFNGRSVSHANLAQLRDQETWLRAQVDRETRGGIRVRGGTVVR